MCETSCFFLMAWIKMGISMVQILKNQPLELIDKFKITPQLLILRFKPIGVPVPLYVPGQFITFLLEKEGKKQFRSYSITNPPGRGDFFEIALSYQPQGLASEFFDNMKLGETVNINGPYGLFVLKDQEAPRRYVLIGTGTGVGPYRSMLDVLTARMQADVHLKIELLMGVRVPEDLLYGQDFRAFAAQQPNFRFYPCYSRCAEVSQADETSGHVQDALKRIDLDAQEDLIYLCGNPSMIEQTAEYLIQLGFGKQSIRKEKYASS